MASRSNSQPMDVPVVIALEMHWVSEDGNLRSRWKATSQRKQLEPAFGRTSAQGSFSQNGFIGDRNLLGPGSAVLAHLARCLCALVGCTANSDSRDRFAARFAHTQSEENFNEFGFAYQQSNPVPW